MSATLKWIIVGLVVLGEIAALGLLILTGKTRQSPLVIPAMLFSAVLTVSITAYVLFFVLE